jgi:hypothetical protein
VYVLSTSVPDNGVGAVGTDPPDPWHGVTLGIVLLGVSAIQATSPVQS